MCVWSDEKCIGHELVNGCATPQTADADCPCVGPDDLVSTKQANYPDYQQVKYPSGVGTSCRAWDKTADPSCAGADAPSWCLSSWCYVDPCTCSVEGAVKSSYFPNLETSNGDPAYYSYATCGGEDSFTGSGGDAAKVACLLVKDEDSCGKRSDCGWNGKQCLGIEVVGKCPGAIAEKEDCSCIDVTQIDASDESSYPFYESGKVDYPAVVGSFCKAWDKTADPSCEGKDSGWCVDAWCYVDPCTCKTGVPVASGYFPELKTITGDRVFYSYATCGAENQYSCTSDDVAEEDRGCPCNTDETSCSADSKCVFKDGKCIGSELAGGCLADQAQKAIPAENCQCISLANIDSSAQADYPHYGSVDYPAAVGTSCRAWDSVSDPGCAGADAPGWCTSAWCYVDPCSCQAADAVKSSYFPNLDTMHGQPLYYSYATCGGGEDSFTCSADDEAKRACACNTKESTCGAGCYWDKTRCIGEELKGTGC